MKVGMGLASKRIEEETRKDEDVGKPVWLSYAAAHWANLLAFSFKAVRGY